MGSLICFTCWSVNKWKDVHNFFTFRQNSWFRIQLENVNRGWTKLWSRSAWLFARHSLLTTSCSPSPSRLVVIPSTLSWKSWSKALVAKRTSPPVSWEESWGGEKKENGQLQRLEKTLHKCLKIQSWIRSPNVIHVEKLSILKKNWMPTMTATTRHHFLLKRNAAMPLWVSYRCLHFGCSKGTRTSFLSKKVPLALFFVLHHLLHLPWDMDATSGCAQRPSLLKMTSEYMFMNTIQCAIVRCTQHPVPGNDVDPGGLSNRYLW